MKFHHDVTMEHIMMSHGLNYGIVLMELGTVIGMPDLVKWHGARF